MTTADIQTAAFNAAYTALMPYTQHAQVRADIAERIVTTLRDHSPQTVVENLYAYPLHEYLRLNRAALAEVVQAAVDALKED